MVVLNEKLILAGQSQRGGWSTKQIAILGEDIKKKGWKYRLRGTIVDDEIYEQFLNEKDRHLHLLTEITMPLW